MIEIAIATELQVHVLEESVLPGGGRYLNTSSIKATL